MRDTVWAGKPQKCAMVITFYPSGDNNIMNYIQKSRVYMFAYLGGHTPWSEMESMVKKFSKEYKSHRCVGDKE
ncbi:MAG: hypothetical protein MJE68_09685 [Proteobacteria bacterium]|nr:hypothetical protein [Pseudomonadota bacterium]